MTADISISSLFDLHLGKLSFFNQMSILGEESLVDKVMVLNPGECPILSAYFVVPKEH
jgi:hypothetical protein